MRLRLTPLLYRAVSLVCADAGVRQLAASATAATPSVTPAEESVEKVYQYVIASVTRFA
jgi:hypothetical protein